MAKRSRVERRKYISLILLLVMLGHMYILSLHYKPKYIESVLNKALPASIYKPIRIKILKRNAYFNKDFRQVVQSENPSDFKKPKESKFLSDKDRKFDRQTMARNNGMFQKAGSGSPSVPDSATTSALKKKSNPKNIHLSDLGQPAEKHPLLSAAKQYAERGPKPSLDHGRSVSSTNDYVENVPLGDLTQLNTQEFKFYGFYHRIREKLEQFWGRTIQEKAELMHKAGRHIAREGEVITALRVTLDALGEIIAITVVGPSGIREMDDAAIEAFNQAGPFPNPPKGMIVEGKVVLEWGFVVKS